MPLDSQERTGLSILPSLPPIVLSRRTAWIIGAAWSLGIRRSHRWPRPLDRVLGAIRDHQPLYLFFIVHWFIDPFFSTPLLLCVSRSLLYQGTAQRFLGRTGFPRTATVAVHI